MTAAAAKQPKADEPKGLELPTIKTVAGITPERAKILIYGEPGHGKTTLATSMVDETLLLATDPGYEHLSVFAQPIGTWDDFREAVRALKKADDRFPVVAVDVVEALYRMCQDETMKAMGRTHPSDREDFGQGWQAVNTAFQSGIATLCSLDRGVVFVSHQREDTIEDFVPYTRVGPDLGAKARTWLTGFVDYVLQVSVEVDEQGERHHIINAGAAKERTIKARVADHPDAVALPDVIERPFDDPAGPLKAAIAAANPQPQEAKADG